MLYSDWLALIKAILNQTVVYGIWVEYFLPRTFYFYLDFHVWLEFLTEKILTTHEIFLC